MPAPPPLQARGCVRLVAVGDILMHQDVKRAAEQDPGGLASLWSEVTPLFQEADLAFANLETPVAPATGKPGIPFQFNAPGDLPAALKVSGIKVLATANNHAYDQGVRGVTETLERLQAEGLVAVGSGLDRPRAETLRIVESQGLRVAFLGFTDLFNANLNRGPAQPWVRPLDLPEAEAAVRAARAVADAVVVSVHWGVEYQHQPHPRQREAALRLARAGADVILGHHPHVLQPVEVLEHNGRRTVVVFSMGNFVSNQDRMYDPAHLPVAAGDSRDGVAFQCRLTRSPSEPGRVTVDEVACEPLWTENNWQAHRSGRARRREIRVVPVTRALRAQAQVLEQLRKNPGADAVRLQAAQERLRTLVLRRERAASILGRAWVLPPDSGWPRWDPPPQASPRSLRGPKPLPPHGPARPRPLPATGNPGGEASPAKVPVPEPTPSSTPVPVPTPREPGPKGEPETPQTPRSPSSVRY